MKNRGFTLVELAIVMLIIGLLIGGILKGGELIRNSRVTATIAQVKAVQAALTTFRDKYDALPGDMITAALRLPGCNNDANCDAAVSGGDSVIGNPNWAVAGVNWPSQAGAPPAAALLLAAPEGETVLFWLHLLASDILSGVTFSALSGGTAQFGETHPISKLGGGFVVGYADGDRPPGAPAGTQGPSGHVLVIAMQPAGALTSVAGQQVLRPGQAAQIDIKLDDNNSRSGDIHGYGVPATCFGGGPTADSYDESSTSNDCGLIFRIDG